jgi:negative regulator of sigma E activity
MADLDLLLRNYLVECAGRERVADREGIVLEVRALHPNRPGARLVVDEISGLLLSAEFRDYRGERTFATRFRTLLTGPDLPRAELPPARRMATRRTPAPPSSCSEASFSPLKPRYLPEGFVPLRERSSARFSETLYSDGLGWICLTQSPADSDEDERIVHQRVEGTRVRMKLRFGGVSLLLVGRLDPAELFRVLDSLGPGSGGRESATPDPGLTYHTDGQARLVLMAVSEDSEDHRRGGSSD